MHTDYTICKRALNSGQGKQNVTNEKPIVSEQLYILETFD